MPLAPEQKNTDYVRQVIVVRKDLSMPVGKIAAMASHASMSFIANKLVTENTKWGKLMGHIELTPEQEQWLIEADPGLEDIGQKSFAKIVVEANSEDQLVALMLHAKKEGLEVHSVTDSGYSHNPAGTLAAIAIGPDTKARIDVVTKDLRIYR